MHAQAQAGAVEKAAACIEPGHAHRVVVGADFVKSAPGRLTVAMRPGVLVGLLQTDFALALAGAQFAGFWQIRAPGSCRESTRAATHRLLCLGLGNGQPETNAPAGGLQPPRVDARAGGLGLGMKAPWSGQGLKWRACAMRQRPALRFSWRWGLRLPLRPGVFHSLALMAPGTREPLAKINVGVPVILCLRPKARLRWMAAVSQLAAAGTFAHHHVLPGGHAVFGAPDVAGLFGRIGAQDRVQEQVHRDVVHVLQVAFKALCNSRSWGLQTRPPCVCRRRARW